MTPAAEAAEPAQTKAAEPNVSAKPTVPVDPNTVLVTVNGENITEGQSAAVDKADYRRQRCGGTEHNQALIDQMKSQLLDNLITDTLVQQQA